VALSENGKLLLKKKFSQRQLITSLNGKVAGILENGV